jgi:hypothetical protein
MKALLLSGAWNDIVGQTSSPKLMKANCSSCQLDTACYADDQLSTALDKISGYYRRLIKFFRTYNASAVVLLHNYDEAYATGEGVFALRDRLKVPMEQCSVPVTQRRDVFEDLEQSFVKRRRLAAEPSLVVIVALKTADVVPMNQWANELHPTSKGFGRLAKRSSCGR